jgi:hypothetical protein
MEITITTKLDFKKYSNLMFRLTYRKPMMIVLTILGFIMLITAILYFVGIPIPFSSTPFFPLFFGVYTLLLPLFIYRTSRKNFSTHKRLHEQITYEFNDGKILITGESFKSEMDWVSLYQIGELPNWILLYQNRMIASVIPKDAFGDKLLDFKNFVISKGLKNNLRK